MAGGFAEGADPARVNLAIRVQDEAHYYIPRIGEIVPTQSPATGKINVNTASAQKLQSLPGIGEQRANAIVDYRTRNGTFSRVEDLLLVSGHRPDDSGRSIGLHNGTLAMVLVITSLAWIAGVYLATLVAFPWPGVLLFVAASALLASLLRRRGLSVLPALALAVLSLGVLRASWPSEAGIVAGIETYNNNMRSVLVEGVISNDPERRTSGWQFHISVNRVYADGVWEDSRGKLLVTARPNAPLIAVRSEPYFRYGDRVVLTGNPEEPPVFQGFDYREYLANQGIFSTMLYPGVEMVGEREGNLALRWIYTLRHRLSRSLSSSLAEPQNSLAQALLLGRRSTMPAELTQAFRDTGTSHILAISGLHVGVLLAFALAASRWLLGAKRQVYLLLPLVAIWGYAVLSGMSPSVQRAAIMGSAYLFGLYLGRQNSIMPSLAFAAAIMVGLQPKVLTSVSFQLSFTAMAGLALLAPPIERGLRRVFSGDEEEAGQWGRALSYPMAATLAATIATLPLVAFYFHQVSLVGLPATLMAMPILAPALGVGLVTAVLGLVSTELAQIAGWGAWLSLSYLKLVVEVFDAIPGNTVRIGWMGAPLVVAYYGVLLGLVAGRSRLPATFPVLQEWVGKALHGVGKIELELPKVAGSGRCRRWRCWPRRAYGLPPSPGQMDSSTSPSWTWARGMPSSSSHQTGDRCW